MNTHDMYGHEIHRLGETGYGVSVSFARNGADENAYIWPYFTVFHASDGFRQSLFSIVLNETDRPNLSNIFSERIKELMATRPHG